MVEVGAFQRWVSLSANFRWKGTSPSNHCWCQKTKVFFLPDNEIHVILSSFIWVQYQRVTDGPRDGRTDGQTDRRNWRSYYSTLHCKQCGRAVKMVEFWYIQHNNVNLLVIFTKHTLSNVYTNRLYRYWWQKHRNGVFAPRLRHSGVTYALHLYLVGKYVIEFL